MNRPMSLDAEEVAKIAWLARIDIDSEAIPDYARNLSSILDFVEQMNAVDTSGIEPMAHPQDVPQRLREDIVTEPNQRETFLKIAPATENGLFLVPRVIE